MPESPYYKIPREEWELRPFVDFIKHIVKIMELNILLLSHQNNCDEKKKFVQGNDHKIIFQIIEILRKENINKEKVFTLSGFYDSATTKTIIANLSALVSGRIHGAINGVSQMIPTLILDYGHEPKAHKLRGFAKLIGIEDFLVDPTNTKSMINNFEKLWDNREKIKKELKKRIPEIQKQALLNYKYLKDIIN